MHAILDIVTACYDNINNKEYTGTFVVALKKAFDTVHHPTLLAKLSHYGIRGLVSTLITAYLR